MAVRIQRGIRVCEKNYLYIEKLISQYKKNPGKSECGHGAAGCSRRDWPGELREWSFLQIFGVKKGGGPAVSKVAGATVDGVSGGPSNGICPCLRRRQLPAGPHSN